MPYYNRDPKRDHNFDNHPYGLYRGCIWVIVGSIGTSDMGYIGNNGRESRKYYSGVIWGLAFGAPFLGLLHPTRESTGKMEKEMETRKYVGVISGVYKDTGRAN